MKENYLRQYSSITETVLLNLFYLSSYDCFVELMENRNSKELFRNKIFDEENYLHFLIVLYYNPPPLILYRSYDKFREEYLPKVLGQRLVLYISQKLTELSKNPGKFNKNLPSYYILLLPMSSWKKSLPSIVKDLKKMKMFNWPMISEMMSAYYMKETYETAMRATIISLYKGSESEYEILEISSLFL